MDDPDLTGRTALVTGSAKGIGRDLTLRLAGAGADVAVHYRTSSDAANTTAADARAHDVAATTVQADVTDEDDVAALFETVADDLAPVDLLVTNVGAFDPRHWTELTTDDWHQVLDTNLTATYLCCRAALPAMREADFGRIVTVGYAGADRMLVHPKNAPYFIAKAGVLMFTRMLAADTQDDGVTVNAVSPYVVETSDAFPDDLPRGRAATTAEIADAAMYFLDPANEYVSGQNIAVDGGWLPERV
jgi:NAD(P)-dependent dehydrogenase (short-subunit alcohol dehydrogenase family)